MKRPFIYGLIVLGVAAPLALYFWDTRDVDEVKRAVIKIGFDPWVPPNKALTLGSFYYVALDGSRPRPVCSTSAQVVDPMVEISPLEEMDATRLGNAHANMQAALLHTVKAQASINSDLNIQYSFKDTKMYQVNGSNLISLELALLDEKNCSAAVAEYVNNVGIICQVQSALMATVKYVVKRKDGHKLAEDEIKQIKNALEASSAMQGMTVHESNVEGTGLYYGVMFKPKCITNSDFELVYPQNRMERFLLHTRLLWRRMTS